MWSQLKWLNIKQVEELHTAVLTYKTKNGLAPHISPIWYVMSVMYIAMLQEVVQMVPIRRQTSSNIENVPIQSHHDQE